MKIHARAMSRTQPGGRAVALSKKAALVWVLPNILGIVAYLYLSSATWVLPQAPAGGPGDPIIWVLTALPVIAACSMLNLIWIIRIAVKRDKNWKSAAIWLVCVVVWYAAYSYDGYRSSPNGAQAVTPASN